MSTVEVGPNQRVRPSWNYGDVSGLDRGAQQLQMLESIRSAIEEQTRVLREIQVDMQVTREQVGKLDRRMRDAGMKIRR